MRMSNDHTIGYLPGMGLHWLLPLYDPISRLLGMEAPHLRLTDQAGLGPGRRVLEIGCGTGNLALLAKRLHPQAEITGLDPDPQALARARRKAASHGLALRLDQGFAGALPYADASFDRVLSSFMLHHLDEAERRRALSEAARVLKPGGSLHVVDIRADGLGERMAAAGFADAFEIGTGRWRWMARYAFFRGHRPRA
jgi:ubiquinone/menaquinone biosynthesis C-methylase UbiE